VSSRTIQDKQPLNINSSANFLKGVTKVAGGTMLVTTMLASALVAGGLVGLAISFRNLPDVRTLKNYSPPETTYIYDVKGKHLASIHGEANREVVPLDKISPNLKLGVLAIEDSHFYQHQGINFNSIGRAVKANFEEGGVREGASTITMQLVKNLFLSPEQKFTRKLAEGVLAVRIEQILKKDEILELYLNQVYWGHNNYGAETAAQSYFGKHASELNLAEGTMMAGIISAPSKYSPFINMKSAKKRQIEVLDRMVTLGWISDREAATAKKQPIKLGTLTSWQDKDLPYVTDTVVQELEARFGKDVVEKGGLRVQTTIDASFQQMAEDVVNRAARRLPRYQIALVAVDPRTHFVKAMVGGVNYEKSKFNRATQARRQPGSSFKPFVYYTAFASGKFTPDSIVVDAPIRYRDGTAKGYTPKNYGGTFAGSMSIRQAVMVSSNIPAIKVGRSVGLDKVIQVCRTLGIKSPIEPVISLPLGSVDLTPLEMAGGFSTFASNGWYSPTTSILRVTDSAGNIILDNTPKPKLVLDPWATASLSSVLASVVTGGTGKNAQIGRPAAGKTGTTSSERDVWFVGYVPQLSTAVWIGKDNYKPLGKGVTGGDYAAPIWRSFMSKALKDVPVEYFPAASQFKRPSKN
jgi:1A family penicillin-binding protein